MRHDEPAPAHACDFATLRQGFREAAERAGAELSEYVHPLNGPDGETLATDVALLGRRDARKLIVLISGTHGVEGPFGSTCQTAWLGRYPQVSVQVAGNCDDRGTEEYNLALGQRRANAARDYLVARGVQSARITTISYGKDRPTALGNDEQSWAQNRNAITSVR